MPGRYIHMDVARRALASLAQNAGAAEIFASGGWPAEAISKVARENPAYVALGAIGPDFFFLMPDFKPPAGLGLWGCAKLIEEFYGTLEETFLDPYEDQFTPLERNDEDIENAASGGRSRQRARRRAMAIELAEMTAKAALSTQYDVWGLTGSGVAQGCDEQAFAWNDMLHYRKTYEFAARLWRKATELNNDRFRAYALGWMTHVATDVTGHGFVNEKCGGPYRLASLSEEVCPHEPANTVA